MEHHLNDGRNQYTVRLSSISFNRYLHRHKKQVQRTIESPDPIDWPIPQIGVFNWSSMILQLVVRTTRIDSSIIRTAFFPGDLAQYLKIPSWSNVGLVRERFTPVIIC